MNLIFKDNLRFREWDEFIKENAADGGFLQSWPWGEFIGQVQSPKLKVKSHNIFRLAVIDKTENILAAAQIIKQKLPLGQGYFYIPRGPVLNQLIVNSQKPAPSKVEGLKVLEFLFSEIKKSAEKEGVIFLRFDPAWDNQEANQELLKNFSAVFSGQVQPLETLILDLTLSSERLLSQMKPKTRYNIKVAQKHCLTINEGANYFNDFWRLMQATARRDRFIPHPKNYYQTMLEVFGKRGEMKLIVAQDAGRVIAANLVVFYGDWCAYLHGASDYNSREKMAPYLLQWEAILTAKSQGRKYYDFWGVAEQKWPGLTRFKQSFAPQKKFTRYLGSWDMIYRPLPYRLYNFLRRR